MYRLVISLGLIMGSCAVKTPSGERQIQGDVFKLAFGSCNKQQLSNPLWDDVVASDPDVWVWGGDNVYADTRDMRKMRRDYEEQRYQDGYRQLTDQVQILGVWDDHDYGLQDGGREFDMKQESQQLFLDFMNVPRHDPRRKQEGIYHSRTFSGPRGSVKVILLDTRYFRSPLTKNLGAEGDRYLPNPDPGSTILGAEQWAWLEAELRNSKANFNLIVSSIQVLSDKHGFETWGNFPSEEKRLLNLIRDSGAKGVILLSGDRHFSEFSQVNVQGMDYPLIDFTSSGLTHTYTSFSGEENPFRVGRVVTDKSFGLIELNLSRKTATLQMRGDGNQVLQEIKQAY